ncbi:MAG: hypothetical protein CV045_01430 [Cyanobacteria bacterium M5B4]|nr:MAG: hypothetical protein CV045_01430 [Cyanobacteria bacterium M5B4]
MIVVGSVSHFTAMGRQICRFLLILWLTLLVCSYPAQASPRPVLPSAKLTGWDWQNLTTEIQQSYCVQAFAAFRGSPAQSYIISHGVQSLTPAGLCDRLTQFYSIEDNRDTPIATAAALAPILFADTPIGTRY